MGTKIVLPGRDKAERARFATDQTFINKMANEVNMLHIMADQKKFIRYLRGSWWNRFICWMTDRDPVFTTANTAKNYASRSIERGAGSRKAPNRKE